MRYQPQEGVDYITDLYQVADVAQDAAATDIKQALNARAREYHPDRLEGLAPEFRQKGERMVCLLNRARTILLDEDKRAEYDVILGEWEGPVSSDGTPTITVDADYRANLSMLEPDAIEAAFAAKRTQLEEMVKHNPKQQAMLKRLYEAADGEDAEELREAYDAALFAEDQVLAIDETERGRLIGLTHNPRYETALGYGDSVQLAIEDAKDVLTEDYQRRAVGGVGMRLALLAGETPSEQSTQDVVPAAAVLPAFFDEQAKKVEELARQREALLEKRLEIFQPKYPVAEVQTEARPNFAIGVVNDQTGEFVAWVGFNFSAELAKIELSVALTNVEIPEDIQALLDAGEYEQAYNAGFNVLTFATKDQISANELLVEAYNKHLRKYFPDAFNQA